MIKQNLISSAIVAGVMAMTAGGVMAQRPDPVSPKANAAAPASREAVRADARVQNKNQANSLTPGGEPSTTTNNQPNMQPKPMSGTTRGEVRAETLKVKPQFGQKGERPDVPTNPKTETGTPK